MKLSLIFLFCFMDSPSGFSQELPPTLQSISVARIPASMQLTITRISYLNTSHLAISYVKTAGSRVGVNRRVKHVISGYPFKDEQLHSSDKNRRRVERIAYTDTVLRGGVWRGAIIGGLVGMAAAGLAIAALNDDILLSPTRDQRVLMVAWGGVNGAGLGGFIGFGRQRKKQRRLNKL